MNTLTTPDPITVPIEKPARAASRYLTYPAVLLANAALVAWAVAAGVSLEAATGAGLLATIAVLFALERAIPYDREWYPDVKETVRDFLYFGLNGAMDAIVKLGVAFAVAEVGAWDNGLPFVVALPLGILVADFGGYWLHRWGHRGWLWKVHGVHHTPDKVNTWNNNTIHFLNSIYSGAAKTLPLALLGFDPSVIIIAAYATTIQSYAVHANIDVELGWLGYLIMGPSHHRLHHSTVIEEAGNFASAVTVWDIAFGTFVYGPGRAPAQVGVVKTETFPSPMNVIRNQLHPFIDQASKASRSSSGRHRRRHPFDAESGRSATELVAPSLSAR